MIKVEGSSRSKEVQVNSDRKVVIEGTTYDLANISALADSYKDEKYSTMTIENVVNRAGAGVDERSAFEKGHTTGNSSRFSFTIPFDTEDPKMMEIAKTVEEALEDYLRNCLSKFIKDNKIIADRDQMVRSEAYRRAKRDATYDRQLTEAERDRLIGHLMPKKKHQGTFNLGVRVSVRNPKYDKQNSPAWRDTANGRAGVYNAYGASKCPLSSKLLVSKAEILSKEVAKLLIPVIADKTDLMTIWKDLTEVVANLPKVEKANAKYEFSSEEELLIEKIKMDMIQAMSVGGNN